MSKKKKIIILFIILVFILGVMLAVCSLFKKDSSYKLLIDDNSLDVDIGDISNDSYEDNTDDIINSTINENINDVDATDESGNNDVFYTEENVVNYFEGIELEVDSSTSFKEKFKEYFILIVDFIFYDGEIKGYRFNELSDIAKIKIVAIALKVDNKIEEYIPNYKESISSTGSKVYNNVKDRCISLYMEISVDICTKNKDECNKVKEIFTEIKDVCKIGWNYIKELTSKGLNNLKEWYEIYSGK